MNSSETIAAVEGILFAAGEPVSLQEISDALDLSPSEVQLALNELHTMCQADNRGIQLIRMNTKYQLCSKPECHKYIESLMKGRNHTGLSQAALESLAIIAYKQPITRIEIESLRGVKSSSSLQLLMDRDLIKTAGRLNAPGKPILYETSLEFLKYAGISSIKGLPPYEDFMDEMGQVAEQVAIHLVED